MLAWLIHDLIHGCASCVRWVRRARRVQRSHLPDLLMHRECSSTTLPAIAVSHYAGTLCGRVCDNNFTSDGGNGCACSGDYVGEFCELVGCLHGGLPRHGECECPQHREGVQCEYVPDLTAAIHLRQRRIDADGNLRPHWGHCKPHRERSRSLRREEAALGNANKTPSLRPSSSCGDDEDCVR